MFDERYEGLFDAQLYAGKTKQPRAGTSSSSSATSRKNKLQRCSVCGGLGHKSRTCEQTAYKTVTETMSSAFISAPEPGSDPRTVLAACGLLMLSQPQAEPNGMLPPWQPPPPLMPQQPQSQGPMSAAAPSHHHQGGMVQPPPMSQMQTQPGLKFAPNSPPCSPSSMSIHPWPSISPRMLAT